MVQYLLLTGLPALVFGLYIFGQASHEWLKILLGCLGFYLILQHFVAFLPRIKHFTPLKIMITGVFFGLLSGIIVGTPIKVMLLKWRGLVKHEFIGTSAFISFCTSIIKLVGFVLMGFLTVADFWLWIPIFGGVTFVGTLIGRKILDYVSVRVFEGLMLAIIFIGSVHLMFF